MKILTKISLAILSLLISTYSSAAQYQFTDLGTLSIGKNSYATDINNLGQVVGYSNSGNGYRAVLYNSKNGMQELGTFKDGTNSYAFGINDSGQVVGKSNNTAFLYESKSGMQSLGFLPGGRVSSAYDINNNGQIVGTSNVKSFYSPRTFLYDANNPSAAMKSFGSLAKDAFSVANAINDTGTVVGSSHKYNPGTHVSHAFSYNSADSDAQLQDLGILDGLENSTYYVESWAYDINERGQIVGFSENSWAENRAILYDRINGMQNLGVLSGTTESKAYSINNSGQVVGTSLIPNRGNFNKRAFLYHNNIMIDLNTLLDSSFNDWWLMSASAINDNGQIVGNAYSKTLGRTHAYLLTPVPEPSTYAMMGLGLFGLMAYSRKRKLH